ncbi:MAG: xylulokinase [Caldicoprobacterales bacterium]|jgi:xylulokinase|nr:xylulokinase [Clostridiales bacterium]
MAKGNFILTYDIGTTGNKCTVFDEEGKKVWSTVSGYDTIYPQPGWSEQRPEDFWRSVIEATRELTEKYGMNPMDIEVIGLSGHMNGCLPVDSQGQPLFNNIIHSDVRTESECQALSKVFQSNEIYEITGNRIDPHYTLPKILWLKRHYPKVYENTAYFLNTKDYIAYKLTGNLGITDYSDASLTCIMDIKARKWSEDIVKSVGIDMGKLPQIIKSHDIVGKLSKEAASILGLKEGIPVVAGGGDGACAAKGAGVVREGMAYNYIGSSSWISTPSKTPILDKKARIFNICDLDGIHYNVIGTVQSATICYDWVIDNLGRYEKELAITNNDNIFEIIQGLAEESPIGSRGVFFVPYMMGERTPHWDADARGGFIGFTLYHNRNDLFRAVYEGVSYALRSVLDAFEENQHNVEKLNLIGGGAKSTLWNEIMCNVYNRPLYIHAHPGEATSLGAAIAAGVGVKMFKSFDEAEGIIEFSKNFTPHPESVKEYRRYYEVYKMIYPSLKPVYDAIAML